jgi:hypothetical protein
VTTNNGQTLFVFPKWTNQLRNVVGVGVVIVPVYAVALLWYGGSPRTTAVGYAPTQPIAYSHAMHAGKHGVDCRYCHTTVENAAFAAVPSTQICMNCHAKVVPETPKIVPLKEAFATGMPIQWIKVHDLPQYVYFNHSSHVNVGVGCVSCHGRIDKMDVVRQVEMLSMGWCLDCHRNPEPNLRPKEFVTKMDWAPNEDASTLGARLRKELNINPGTDCSTCHR